MAGLDRERLVAARLMIPGRNGRPLSQDAAADLIGVTTDTVKNWESGRRQKVSPADLSRIADAYGCTTDWLLGRTDVGPVQRAKPAQPPSEAPDGRQLDEFQPGQSQRETRRSE